MTLQDVTNQGKARVRHIEDRADGAIRHGYAAHYGRIHANLSRLLSQAQRAIDNGATITMSWLHQHGLADTQRLTEREIGQFASLARGVTLSSANEALTPAVETALAQLEAALPPRVHLAFTRPNPDALAHLVEDGRIERYFDAMPEMARTRMTQILYSGLAGGQSPYVVAEELADGLAMPLNKALTIARTETQTAYRSANLASYQANADVVDGWTWLAAPGCCAFCADMNGSQHSLDEEMDTHPNCRCAEQPITKSYSDILSQLDGATDTSADAMEDV